ncbi:hypothetical protein [Photobacterium jeanii]|uniref:hypothetical protein n=1 Tax=Photobacterium jeanii TaxID=858640 RepID=UPI000A7FAD9D|nr:hypothetical protein [Photobacterium jeanii]
MIKLLLILALNSVPVILLVANIFPLDCNSVLNSLLNLFSAEDVNWLCEQNNLSDS